MKASALIKFLKIAMINNRKVLLQSAPGNGKTEIVKQVAKELNYDILILHPVVCDPVDFKGFPFVASNGTADFIPFGNLLQMMQANKPLVVLADDVGQSAQSVQSALMQIIQERKINGKLISPEVRFIAATNRRKDNAGVGNLITPLLNRFDTIIELEIDANDWCKWAMSVNLPIELISFIRFRPDLISTFKAEKDIKNFSSPRSCEALGKWIQQGITDFEVWQGCVGEAFAVEFKAFYDTFRSISHIPDQVFNNPQKAEVPTKPDIIYALMGVLSKRANDVNIDNLFIYMDRLTIEYQVVIVSNLITMKPELTSTKAYIDWCVKNPDKI